MNSSLYRAALTPQLNAVRSAVAAGRDPAPALRRAGNAGNPIAAMMASSPIKVAVVCGDVDLVRRLVKAGHCNMNRAMDADGTYPLHVACALGDFAMVKMLTSQEPVNLDCTDENNSTPL